MSIYESKEKETNMKPNGFDPQEGVRSTLQCPHEIAHGTQGMCLMGTRKAPFFMLVSSSLSFQTKKDHL